MIEVVTTEPQLKHGTLPVLARAAYLRCKSEDFGWIVSDHFVLPFFIDKKLIFSRMVFTYEPIPMAIEDASGDQNVFWNQAVDKVRSMKRIDFIFKAQSNVVLQTYPDGATFVPWGTLEVNIQKTDEQLLEACHGKHRNVIRKAQKDGVTVREESDPHLIYNVISETMKRQKVPYFPSLNYLSGLKERLPGQVLFLVAEWNSVIQGCAVILFDENKAHYMYGGSIAKPSSGSLNILHYEAMKRLRDLGVKTYDMVGARIKVVPGSKQEGIQNFKSRFGAELRQGYAFRYVFHPVRYFAFNFIAKSYLFLKGMKYTDPIEQIQREMK